MTLHITSCERSDPPPDLCAAAKPIIESLEASGHDSAARLMAAMSEQIVALRAVVEKAREYMGETRVELLESMCVMEDGEPDLETLTADDREAYIEPLDALLAEIDEALK